jgi:hypothetical protein
MGLSLYGGCVMRVQSAAIKQIYRFSYPHALQASRNFLLMHRTAVEKNLPVNAMLQIVFRLAHCIQGKIALLHL